MFNAAVDPDPCGNLMLAVDRGLVPPAGVVSDWKERGTRILRIGADADGSPYYKHVPVCLVALPGSPWQADTLAAVGCGLFPGRGHTSESRDASCSSSHLCRRGWIPWFQDVDRGQLGAEYWARYFSLHLQVAWSCLSDDWRCQDYADSRET